MTLVCSSLLVVGKCDEVSHSCWQSLIWEIDDNSQSQQQIFLCSIISKPLLFNHLYSCSSLTAIVKHQTIYSINQKDISVLCMFYSLILNIFSLHIFRQLLSEQQSLRISCSIQGSQGAGSRGVQKNTFRAEVIHLLMSVIIIGILL